ncbi:proton myo-inositol cotransporter-like [Patiria miniata]|uniref:Major facilitator superfamily (MFS) profile domain-containing protein n=1 Tax=Patiria miniata TaxID=46514 RepID=A0A914B1J7_PATMI|nr:proton myo-inositol cotransporter-like [Patiria miniata]
MLEMTSMLTDAKPGSDDTADGNDNPDASMNGDSSKRALVRPSSPPPITGFTKVLVAFAALGGFLFGYDTGVVSGAMILLRQEFNLNTLWQELVVSVTIAAAAVAALFGGKLNDVFGRKPVILLASAIFTTGAVVMSISQSKEILLVGRIIVGLGVGLASMTVPMYIAEAAPAHLRGRLVTINNLFITGGQFVASVIDGSLSYWPWGWRLMLGLGAVPSAIQLIGFIFLPESPRWLILHDRPQKAKKVLTLIYGKGSPEVGSQLEKISKSVLEQREEQQAMKGSNWVILRILQTPPVLKAVIVGCSLQMFQQLAGINTVMYYSATIIRMSGVKDNSTVIWLAAVVGFVNFLFTFVGVYLVDRLGRRILTLGSLSGVTFSHMFLGIGFLLMAINAPPVTVHNPQAGQCGTYSNCERCILQEECGFCFDVNRTGSVVNGSCLPINESSTGYSNVGRCSAAEGFVDGSGELDWSEEYCPTKFGIMALVGLIVYLMFFAPGMGPMPWTINSEIYPQWARSTGNALSSTTNWLFNLLISMTFLSLAETITRQGTFFMYAGISLAGVLFLYCLLPETKGRPLEEVINLFSKPWSPCCGEDASRSYKPLDGSSFQDEKEDQREPLLFPDDDRQSHDVAAVT